MGVSHALSASTQKAEEGRISEFDASLVYTVNSYLRGGGREQAKRGQLQSPGRLAQARSLLQKPREPLT